MFKKLLNLIKSKRKSKDKKKGMEYKSLLKGKSLIDIHSSYGEVITYIKMSSKVDIK